VKLNEAKPTCVVDRSEPLAVGVVYGSLESPPQIVVREFGPGHEFLSLVDEHTYEDHT
jgi:hypothetical protein